MIVAVRRMTVVCALAVLAPASSAAAIAAWRKCVISSSSEVLSRRANARLRGGVPPAIADG